MAPAERPDTARTLFADVSIAERRQRSLDLQSEQMSDVARWADPGNLGQLWKMRAEAVSDLIPAASRVIDIGCGTMVLEQYLKPGCTYLPADLVRRDERTLVFDANAGEIPDVEADIAVILGVLEYVHEPAEFLRKVAANWARLILTYHPIEYGKGGDRRAKGWFNDLTEEQVLEMCASASYDLVSARSLGSSERIYDLRRRG